MTPEEAIKIIKSECYVANLMNLDRTKMVNSALDVAIKALEQQPCEDCVSREEVIRIIKDHPKIVGDRSILVQKVVELPSQPYKSESEVDE